MFARDSASLRDFCIGSIFQTGKFHPFFIYSMSVWCKRELNRGAKADLFLYSPQAVITEGKDHK